MKVTDGGIMKVKVHDGVICKNYYVERAEKRNYLRHRLNDV